MRRESTGRKLLVWMFAALLLAGLIGVPGERAYAGMSAVTVVSPSDIRDGKQSGAYLASGDVTFEDNRAVFAPIADGQSQNLIAKTSVLNGVKDGLTELFHMESTVEILALKDGTRQGSFSVCFGMQRLSAEVGAENSVEIRFVYGQTAAGRDAISMGVYEYAEDGANSSETCNYDVLKAEAPLIGLSYNNPFCLEISARTDGGLDLIFRDSPGGTVLKEYAGLSFRGTGSGFLGFYGSGFHQVRVSDTSVGAYSYYYADNVDFTETFSHDGVDCYNKNYLYSQSTAGPFSPSRVYASEGELVIENGSGVQIDTKYEYSNFELEMDITYLQRNAAFAEGFDPAGKTSEEISNHVKTPISCWFGIAFGMSSSSLGVESTPHFTKYLLFEGIPYGEKTPRWKEYATPNYVLTDNTMRSTMSDPWNNLRVQSMKQNASGGRGLNLWDSSLANDEAVRLKLCMTDGKLELYLKFVTEQDYGEPQFSYDFGYTPSGYIRIFSCGSAAMPSGGPGYAMTQNLKIDNLSLKNTDYEKVSLEDPGFESNLRDKTEDYPAPEGPDEEDLSYGFTLESSGGCGSSAAASALLPGMAAIGFAAASAGRKRK